ncbi:MULTISPECIES: TIGR02234 family membrane protein [unclassified Modestobacter]|uniref:TIGR02234 family membrane protein n=1 Tax=unclassified Modestobacter TaxID=2643866 RepID=UPI0022A9F6FE|nr:MULTISPECIES: TIGR02234 family membrane protein [unclassified Modestobacter]MCZ2824871.1 TIGR02234 family membrane protein [Modestobacter sp. VKM Ac-2981]MCZ2854626.1 TIGR02234 family membrane protein [Modestobacter sp. VKM Ac-2982]
MSHPAPSAPAPATGRGRRELTVAVLLCALSGGLALSASGEPWADVTIVREPPLPPTAEVLTGSQAAPLVAACGLLLLAAALAVIAVRGAGRVVVGLLVAASGGVLGWSGLRAVTGSLDLGGAGVTSGIGLGQAEVTVDPVTTWPAVALVAGVLGVLAGALVVLRGREWPGMGRRYERTGQPAETAPAPARPTRPARPETDEDRHQAAWKALDRGDDPTV